METTRRNILKGLSAGAMGTSAGLTLTALNAGAASAQTGEPIKIGFMTALSGA
ncbi:hypothetical protein CEV33_4700, partial [Brucella grignonensis]